MRQAKVLYKNHEAGILTQHDDGSFTFRYHETWMADNKCPAISLTLPKIKQEYHSAYLFPFFFNLLPEGSNKHIICKHNRIDADDHFSLLMAVGKNDSVGAVRVFKIDETS